MLLRTLSLLVFVLALPLSASAALFQITATGTVTQSTDAVGNVFGLGSGLNTAVGQAITLTFVFDTALAPTDSNGSPSNGNYQDSNLVSASFLSSTWSVNGRSYTSFAGTGQSEELVRFSDSALGDGVSLTKVDWDYSPVQRNYYAAMGVIAQPALASVVQGDALMQPASALNANGVFTSCQCAVFWRDGATGQDALAVFTVSSLTYQGYAVPEPAPAALLAASALAFGALRLRRRRG